MYQYTPFNTSTRSTQRLMYISTNKNKSGINIHQYHYTHRNDGTLSQNHYPPNTGNTMYLTDGQQQSKSQQRGNNTAEQAVWNQRSPAQDGKVYQCYWSPSVTGTGWQSLSMLLVSQCNWHRMAKFITATGLPV